ncbi:ribonuclease H-like protein [Schizophyllum commune Loenen D]|nr:ribonuclease H-like protein [Schizophyllum commune Loenen D]
MPRAVRVDVAERLSANSKAVSHSAHDNPLYDTSTDPERREGIQGRKMLFCEYMSTTYSPEDFIQVCDNCLQYSARCCQHEHTGKACHHFRLIFTDGACAGNGKDGAAAGIGVVLGKIGRGIDSFAYAVTEQMDPGQRRTSQRAELLAALAGVRRSMHADVHDYDDYNDAVPKERIIVTDSEYVVRGITEWLPQWKRNGWRTSLGSTPANMDLFLQLEREMEDLEVDNNVKFGFWHVPRHLNQEADKLAKIGAAAAQKKASAAAN